MEVDARALLHSESLMFCFNYVLDSGILFCIYLMKNMIFLFSLTFNNTQVLMYDPLFCLPCFASEMLITSLVTSYRLFNHTIYHGSISKSVQEHVVSTPSIAL